MDKPRVEWDATDPDYYMEMALIKPGENLSDVHYRRSYVARISPDQFQNFVQNQSEKWSAPIRKLQTETMMMAGGTNFVEKYSYNAKPNRVVAILKAREAGTAERLQCKIE